MYMEIKARHIKSIHLLRVFQAWHKQMFDLNRNIGKCFF